MLAPRLVAVIVNLRTDPSLVDEWSTTAANSKSAARASTVVKSESMSFVAVGSKTESVEILANRLLGPNSLTMPLATKLAELPESRRAKSQRRSPAEYDPELTDGVVSTSESGIDRSTEMLLAGFGPWFVAVTVNLVDDPLAGLRTSAATLTSRSATGGVSTTESLSLPESGSRLEAPTNVPSIECGLPSATLALIVNTNESPSLSAGIRHCPLDRSQLPASASADST